MSAEDWIADARAFYSARPWITEMLGEDPSNIALPLEVLERRWRVRTLLRDLVCSARTDRDRKAVIENIARATVVGDLTKKQAHAFIRSMETNP